MIKQGIKNYIKNLKYFFTPLGTIALGFVFGLSVLIPGTIASVESLIEEVKNILSNTSIDFTSLKERVINTVKALDWNEPLTALQTVLSIEWLTDTLNICIGSLIENSEAFTIPINEAANTFINNLAAYFIVLIVFTLLGVISGFFLTKWLVRRNMAKRIWWKYFLNSFIDSLLTATLVALCLWLINIWKPSILITAFISIILFGFISLFEAYIIHAWKKVDLKLIVNGKNIFMLFATNLIIFILAAILVGIATALTNSIVGIFVGIAIIEIAFIVIGLNAESYVKSLVPKTDK